MPKAMQKLSPEDQLDIAIKNAARDADPKMTSREVAQEFYESNRPFVEPFVSLYVVEQLARVIGSYRAKARREKNPQLVWEGMLGIRHLPSRLKGKDGKSVARGEATIGFYQSRAAELGKRDSPERTAALRVVELMAKYTPQNRTITWAEVAEMEAEKARKK